MIISFANQKGGVGKSTLVIAYANYLATVKKVPVKIWDWDYQKSLYTKFVQDEETSLDKLYDVEVVEHDSNLFQDINNILELKDDETIHLFDLAGTLDANYTDLLRYSDFTIIPFEYSDFTIQSTLIFINILGLIESDTEKIFVPFRIDKGVNYRKKELINSELERFGVITKPVYKRKSLQTINTRKMTSKQKQDIFKTIIDIHKDIDK